MCIDETIPAASRLLSTQHFPQALRPRASHPPVGEVPAGRRQVGGKSCLFAAEIAEPAARRVELVAGPSTLDATAFVVEHAVLILDRRGPAAIPDAQLPFPLAEDAIRLTHLSPPAVTTDPACEEGKS